MYLLSKDDCYPHALLGALVKEGAQTAVDAEAGE